MNDLEQELRELLETKARESRVAPQAAKDVLRRARRRQVRTGAIALFAAAAVVVGAIAGLGALRVDRGRQTPANRPIELAVAPAGFRSAVLPYASIAYPDGWYLMDTSPLVPYGIARPESLGSDPVLQLANFDPDLRISPRCMIDPDALPNGGVLLTVGVLDPADTSLPGPTGPWPVQLTRNTKDDPVCPSDLWQASWRTPSGMQYWAAALYARDASDADRALLEQAFATLAFPHTAEPQMTRMVAFQSQGTPRLVLDSAVVDGDPHTLVAYLELGKSLWVGVSSPASGRGRGGGAIGLDTGSQPSEEPVSTTMTGWAEGAVVWGTVSPEVARAEIRTDEGKTFPATIVPFPASLGRTDRAVWGFVEGETQYAQGVAYDAEGNLLWPTDLPTAPPTELATGVDPIGGPWTLAIIHSTDGDGLSFEFEEHGGGSGCCLQPLGDGDLRLDGWGTTGGAPSNITAFVSTRVARVEVAMDTGETFEGRLFPMPEKYFGPAQVVLVFVPEKVPIQGYVVAYDAQGNELAREQVGDLPEPSGPTPEIDMVWQSLYEARDATGRYAAAYDGSLAGFDARAAASVEPRVAWNDSSTSVPNEVSIRGLAANQLVLASVTPGGDAYCIGVYIDENGGGGYRYGMVDAPTYDDCRGGWE